MLLKTLNQAIQDSKKNVISFSIRQGLLLRQAKETFRGVASAYKHIISSCNISSSYANFLISLHELIEKYPRLNYCSVPIRLFTNNMKIIREICQEESDFWSNII